MTETAESRPRGRLSLWAGAVVLLALLMTACGSGDGATPDDDGTTGGTDPVEAEPYLPVPEGVTLTEPGSELGLKEAAVVAWEPRQERVGVLEVKVIRLQRTTWRESFSGWQVDDSTRKSMIPYFVHARVTNVGDTDLGDQAVPLYGFDSEAGLIESSKFRDRFGPCPGNGVFPEKFPAEASEKVCLVYLVEQGRRLHGVSFRPTQEFDQIAWTGKVEQPAKSPKKKPGKKQARKKQQGNG